MVIAVSGKIELNLENTLYRLQKGNCAFIKKELVHYIEAEPHAIAHIIKTNSSLVDDIIQNKTLASPVLNNSYSIDELTSRLKKEQREKKEYAAIIADAAVACFIAEVFRTETCLKEPLPNNAANKYKNLLQWLWESYPYVTFSDAANFMNFSKPYFSRYFQKFTGMSFTEYINTLRISAAVEKIMRKEMSVTEISIACGFSSIRHFNRIFKAYTGFAPKSLPDDFSFTHKINEPEGFDPTLQITKILE